MILSEVYKNEIESAKNELDFETKYIAIDEVDGAVYVYQDEPHIPDSLDPEEATYFDLGTEDTTYFDIGTGGMARIAEGNYCDFEEVLEYIGEDS